jgi:PTH1 family peptidyl-tRNA hydrolase
MKLIVGIGNPGVDYDRTRHNVGFEVIDRLARRLAPGEPARSRFNGSTIEVIGDEEKILLLKPLTYVNRTGESLSEAVRFYKLNPAEELLVVVDDVALPCGSIRLRTEGGSGGHHGLENIASHLGSATWSRLRIGIDAPRPGQPLEKHVLERFRPDEQDTIDAACDRAAEAAACWINEGATRTMNEFNPA